MMLKKFNFMFTVIVLYTGALQAAARVDKVNGETTDSLLEQLSECDLFPHLEISGMRLNFASGLVYPAAPYPIFFTWL